MTRLREGENIGFICQNWYSPRFLTLLLKDKVSTFPSNLIIAKVCPQSKSPFRLHSVTALIQQRPLPSPSIPSTCNSTFFLYTSIFYIPRKFNNSSSLSPYFPPLLSSPLSPFHQPSPAEPLLRSLHHNDQSSESSNQNSLCFNRISLLQATFPLLPYRGELAFYLHHHLQLPNHSLFHRLQVLSLPPKTFLKLQCVQDVFSFREEKLQLKSG